MTPPLLFLDFGSFLQEIKTLIQEVAFLSRDALHIYGGALFFMAWLVIFKFRYRFTALTLIILLVGINELFDLFYYKEKLGYYRWTASLADLFNTVFLPVVILLFLQYHYRLRKNIPT